MSEGIETERQQHYLTSLGCEHGQGYLFSRPVPAADLANSWPARSVCPAPTALPGVKG